MLYHYYDSRKSYAISQNAPRRRPANNPYPTETVDTQKSVYTLFHKKTFFFQILTFFFKF